MERAVYALAGAVLVLAAAIYFGSERYHLAAGLGGVVYIQDARTGEVIEADERELRLGPGGPVRAWLFKSVKAPWTPEQWRAHAESVRRLESDPR